MYLLVSLLAAALPAAFLNDLRTNLRMSSHSLSWIPEFPLFFANAPLGSQVDDVGDAKMDGFRGLPLVRDGALDDREGTIPTDRFGETHKLLPFSQHGFDYLPDRSAAALIGQRDPFRAMGSKFFNA